MAPGPKLPMLMECRNRRRHRNYRHLLSVPLRDSGASATCSGAPIRPSNPLCCLARGLATTVTEYEPGSLDSPSVTVAAPTTPFSLSQHDRYCTILHLTAAGAAQVTSLRRRSYRHSAMSAATASCRSQNSALTGQGLLGSFTCALPPSAGDSSHVLRLRETAVSYGH